MDTPEEEWKKSRTLTNQKILTDLENKMIARGQGTIIHFKD